MEISYQLQGSDLENLRRHLLLRLRQQTGGMAQRIGIGVFIGVIVSFELRLHERENGNWYQYFMWLLPVVLFFASVIWRRIWQQSKYGQGWLEQYVGNYLLNLTPAGISYKAPNGGMSFYAWPEILGFEVSESDLYLYLRRDVAIPIPRSALGDEANVDNFAGKVRDLWASHPDNAEKTLPTLPPPRHLVSAQALVTNLLQAARIVFFIDYDPRSFRVSFGIFLQLLLLNLLCIGIVDYIDARPDPEFNLYGLNKFGTTTLLMLGGVACISNLLMQRANMLRLLVIISASEVVIHLIYFSSWLAAERWLQDFPKVLWGLYMAAVVWTLAAVFRIIRRLYRQPAPSALLLISIYAFFTLSLAGLLPSHRLYYNSEADDGSAEYEAASQLDEEDLFYRQPGLVGDELAALQTQRKGKTDLYFVGFAGQAEERVFFNDVSFARNLLDRRFNTVGRSLVLVNNTDTVYNAPLANRHNLEAVLQGIAQRMDKNEDVLFLYLSSHGAKDHRLSVSFWPLSLNDLTAEDLKAMLDNAGIRNRIIAISACYSGGFLDVLKDDNTLIMTASSRDHVSYGCGDFTRYTYFAESYFVKALANSDSFITAFDQARHLIQEREQSEGLDASGPQIDVGRNIARILRNLEAAPGNTAGPVQQGLLEAGLSFDQRVQQGRRFEQDATALEYVKKNVFPAINTVLSKSLTDCLKQPDASTEKFTLVANIMQDGGIGNVDYKPATNTAQCYGNSLRMLNLPPLPNELSILPVFFDMTLPG